MKVNLKDRLDLTENISPVGSTYKRVQPQREISQTDREQFWVKSQEEERLRLIEEKKRINENRAKIEKERQERELKEAKEREASLRKRDEQIIKLRESERNAVNSIKSEPKPEDNDDNERRHRSEEMRRQRAEELKAITSQSSIRNTRAIFEQNSSAGQLNAIRDTSQTKNKLISSRKELFESNQSSTKPTVDSIKERENDLIQSDINGKHSSKEEEDIKFETNLRESEVIIHSDIASNEATVEESEKISRNGDHNSLIEEPTDVVFTRNLLQETYIESHPLEDIAEEQTWDGMFHSHLLG